jgi:aspartyl-tRNA(Asn)/glutamyl-tRNA(Gln) amidotransferase subunit A
MSDELSRLDATERAARIRQKEVSPVGVLRVHQDRIARLEPILNAIVTSAPDAMVHAQEAERAVMRGDRSGPRHGVPFTIFRPRARRILASTRGLSRAIAARDRRR